MDYKEEKEGSGNRGTMKKVLVLGSACVDVIIRVDHLPKTEEDIHPDGQVFSIGGCAYNVAEILRRFGADFVFVCPVGTGLYGDFVRKELLARGYSDFVELSDRENGCCYCLVEKSGERTFLSCHGAEYTFQKEWMKPFDDTKFDMVYVCGLEVEEPTGEQLVDFLESRKEIEIWFAPGPRVMEIKKDRLDRILSLHPVLHINRAEAALLAGYLSGKTDMPEDWHETAERIYRFTQNSVIVTLGENGAYCVGKSGKGFEAGGFPVQVKDTIGAGDAHVGAVLASLSMGKSLEEAVADANRTAARVVGKEGAGLAEEV